MSKRSNSKGFTLVELIAVLIILAIIALIVTPVILNIVKKTKESANKRSVDAYGRAIELSIATYILDTKKFPTSIDDLEVEYTGNKVNCNVTNLNADSTVYLSECKIGNQEVKDSSTDDGYYHYGEDKPYNSYKVGNQVNYNGINFYVIANSDAKNEAITLLKAEPLTVDEVNTYGKDHVNMYSTYDTSSGYYQTAYNQNGYGGMAYYSSSTCGYPTAGSDTAVDTGCTTDYESSEIKYVIDAWATDKFNAGDLKEDSLGYKARLLTLDDLQADLGYPQLIEGALAIPYNSSTTPSFIYNSSYNCWTMSAYKDYSTIVWRVFNDGRLNFVYVYASSHVVRPVVTLLKSAIEG